MMAKFINHLIALIAKDISWTCHNLMSLWLINNQVLIIVLCWHNVMHDLYPNILVSSIISGHIFFACYEFLSNVVKNAQTFTEGALVRQWSIALALFCEGILAGQCQLVDVELLCDCLGKRKRLHIKIIESTGQDSLKIVKNTWGTSKVE